MSYRERLKFFTGQRLTGDALVSILTVPLLLLLSGELFLYYGSGWGSVVGYSLAIIVCALVPLRYPRDVHVCAAIALLSSLRLVDLTFPQFSADPVIQSIYIYSIAAISVLVIVARTTPDWARINSGSLIWIPVIAPLALGIAYVRTFFAVPEPFFITQGEFSLPLAVSVFMFIALVEEPLFRGVLQGALSNRFNSVYAVFWTAVVYGTMHVVYSVEAAGFAVLMGLSLGVAYEYLKRIEVVIIFHILIGVFSVVNIPI